MKIAYKEINQGIEIHRVYGTCEEVRIPGFIDKKPVISLAPYTFSEEKEEEADLLYEEELSLALDGQDEELLCKDRVKTVYLPDTLQKIGRYTFYGCQNLETLSFSDRFLDVGQGAFTACTSLNHLIVHCCDSVSSCVGEILGDLWQKIQVTYLFDRTDAESYNRGESESYTREEFSLNNRENRDIDRAEFLFPEHYEEAVENTPARILETHYHGVGGNYRQCFYKRQIDCRKYDSIFPKLIAIEHQEVALKLLGNRLLYPWQLSESAKELYENHLQEHLISYLPLMIRWEWKEMLLYLGKHKRYTKEAVTLGIDTAFALETTELLSILMEEQQKLGRGKSKRFQL